MNDILFVDDDGDLLQSLIRVVSKIVSPHSICAAGNADKALCLARSTTPLVCVIDLCLDEKIGVESGFKLLAELKELDSAMRVLVLTGHGAIAHGIRAMQLGAASFIEKPADPYHLAALLKDAIAQANLSRAYAKLARESLTGWGRELCGESASIRALREELEFASSTNQPLLLLGETGTGKGLCARLIHQHSKRALKKFVHYHPNFAGGDIVQSELFGHAKGAFTGALESRRGLVLEAHGGSLFLDELDSIPSETQVLLLDLVQEQRIRPMGSDSFVSIDCRCIAATNIPIDEALDKNVIRRDLHHRLAHCIITVPALRDRLEDIPVLAEGVLRSLQERESLRVAEFEPSAFDKLQTYRWPGNIRELQGVVERAAYRAQFKRRSRICSEDIELRSQPATSADPAQQEGFHRQIEVFKRQLVRRALEVSGGNQVHAAMMLGVDRGTVRRLA